MRLIKKIMSLILVMGFTLADVPVSVSAEGETSWDTECVFGKQSMFKNASVHGEVAGMALPTVVKGGREAWEVQPGSWYHNSAFTDILIMTTEIFLLVKKD